MSIGVRNCSLKTLFPINNSAICFRIFLNVASRLLYGAPPRMSTVPIFYSLGVTYHIQIKPKVCHEPPQRIEYELVFPSLILKPTSLSNVMASECPNSYLNCNKKNDFFREKLSARRGDLCAYL